MHPQRVREGANKRRKEPTKKPADRTMSDSEEDGLRVSSQAKDYLPQITSHDIVFGPVDRYIHTVLSMFHGRSQCIPELLSSFHREYSAPTAMTQSDHPVAESTFWAEKMDKITVLMVLLRALGVTITCNVSTSQQPLTTDYQLGAAFELIIHSHCKFVE